VFKICLDVCFSITRIMLPEGHLWDGRQCPISLYSVLQKGDQRRPPPHGNKYKTKDIHMHEWP